MPPFTSCLESINRNRKDKLENLVVEFLLFCGFYNSDINFLLFVVHDIMNRFSGA